MNSSTLSRIFFSSLIALLFFYEDLCSVQELEPKSISTYIEENYDVLFQSSSVKNLDDVDFYLLAELHHLIGHKHVNSMLINHYAQKDDFVFVEGVPSLHQIQPRDSLQTMWITVPTQMMGWDLDWMKEITGIDLTLIEKLGVELLLIQHEMAWSNSFEKKIEYDRLIAELSPLLQQVQPLFEKDFERIIMEKFPERVAAMNRSLSTALVTQVIIKSLKLMDNHPGSKKVFLMAGLYHLWQDTSHPLLCDPQMSLDSLYDLLNDVKALILIPKQQVTEYWNSFYQLSA